MRLIDADEIRKAAVPHTRGDYGYSADVRKWAVLVGDIDDAPTIDAVPVVRCKDCKWFNVGVGCPIAKSGYFKEGRLLPHENDFCSYGER